MTKTGRVQIRICSPLEKGMCHRKTLCKWLAEKIYVFRRLELIISTVKWLQNMFDLLYGVTKL